MNRQQRRSKKVVRVRALHPLSALAKALPVEPSKVIEMDVKARTCWLKLCEGHAAFADYNTVAWAVNIVEVGLSHLNSPDIATVVEACTQKVGAALERRIATGEWGLTNTSVPEMLDVLDLHQQLLGLVTIGQLDKLVTEIEERRDREGKYIEVSTVS